MKAQELRIGNYFIVNWSKEICKADWMDIRDISDRRIIGGVSPIPLTPEILEKCGFERTGNLNPSASRKFYKIGRIIIEHIAGDRIAVYVDSPLEDILIGYQDHLHQLQNLYHALTGEELNFKP